MDNDSKALQAIEGTLFEQNKGLLHKFTKMGFGRLQGAGVEIEYEDVFQEMTVSFIKAHRTFDSSKGFSFSAYFGRSCMNNFNKWAANLCREQRELGLIRATDMNFGEFEDKGDVLDYFYEDGEQQSPEDMMIAIEEVRQRVGSLSLDAKRMVLHLIAPTQSMRDVFDEEVADAHEMRAQGHNVKISRDHNFSFIGRDLGMTPGRVSEVRKELSRVFKVKL